MRSSFPDYTLWLHHLQHVIRLMMTLHVIVLYFCMQQWTDCRKAMNYLPKNDYHCIMLLATIGWEQFTCHRSFCSLWDAIWLHCAILQHGIDICFFSSMTAFRYLSWCSLIKSCFLFWCWFFCFDMAQLKNGEKGRKLQNWNSSSWETRSMANFLSKGRTGQLD